MIEKILEMASRAAKQAEVFEYSGDETPVQFENNRLKSASNVSTKGYALRIIKDGKIGFSSTTRQDAAEQLVKHAVETAEFGQIAEYELPAQPSSLPKVAVTDPKVAELTVERMVEIGQKALDKVRTAVPEAQVGIGVETSRYRRRIANSRGLDVSYESTYYSVFGSLELITGTDMLQVWEGDGARNLLEADEFVNELISKAKLGKDIVEIESRTMPVIFTPKGFAMTLALPLGMAFSGKEVLQGATPVSDKLGQQAADPRVFVYDDGTIDFSPGSRPFDDEGIAVGKTPLVEKGVVKSFIYDLESAAKAGAKSTGNGQRGLESLPGPRYNFVTMDPGNTPLPEMIKSVKYGLLVDQTIGSWSGNVRGGQFSGNVHYGLLIENGELVGRVKDVMISGNMFEALNNIGTIEDRCHRPVPMMTSMCVPHILFAGLSVAAKG